MKKEFKKCGSGDNVCNCNSADECGYSIPYENTTKKSLADEFCRAYTEFHGELIDNPKQITSHTFTGEELMEFCQFYASQFVKKDDIPDQIQELYHQLPDCGLKNHLAKWFSLVKDSVSSDVEQALANISHYVAGENVDPKFKGLTISVVEYNEAISAIRKWQSTQQQANAELKKEVDKWRDSANYYKDTYPVVIAELEKQNAELVEFIRERMKHEYAKYDADIRYADRHNNSDGVGQAFDYYSPKPLPGWVKQAEHLIQSNENKG